MKEILEEYFKLKNIEYKEMGTDQFVLKVCPNCQDDKFHHCYIGQENGLWNCKKCSYSGNFNHLRSFFGDSSIQLDNSDSEYVSDSEGVPVKKVTTSKPKVYKEVKFDLPLQYASRLWATDTKFLEYLRDTRKLTEETIKRFKLGSTGDNISIPIYEQGKVISIRYRRDPALDSKDDTGAKYTQERGTRSVLFNGDILDGTLKEVFLVEGEFDAMQLIQLGIENVVSGTLGAGSFLNDWKEKFDGVEKITLIYDNDTAGKDGMKHVSEKLGHARCKLVSLPNVSGRDKTDITNFFVDDKKTKQDFFDLIKKAKSLAPVTEESVKHISEFSERLREILLSGEHIGIPVGFKQLDEVMGGLRKGRLVVLAGLTNSGKSSYAINMCLNMAIEKVPSFYFSLEMPPVDIVKKILMLQGKMTNTDLKLVADPSVVLEQIDATLFGFKQLPIYLYNGSGSVKYSVLEQCVKMAKDKYGCKAVFVDHLHYFAANYANMEAEISKAVRDIKQLAMTLEIPIVLLAHLNRGGRTTSRKGLYTPALADLKSSSTIEQDADQVLFVCRDSESENAVDRAKAFIKVAKNRDGAAGRSVSMTFDEGIGSFVEKTDGSDYEGDVKKEDEALKSVLVEDAAPF